MLVTLLTGVFDPPPEQLSTPGLYIVGLVFAALVSVAIAVIGAQRGSRIAVVQRLEELQ
ncbi:hypothetical protein [Bosea sp. TAF32]|uniref:hypothetical protein n=1 Tax=Bosea sp. TAF32 TaxID=3237482 RepID=UPI003F8E1829